MEPIRAAASIRIDQCGLQVVLAQKPSERAHRPRRPLRAAIRRPRGEASRNRRCRLDWLLIKRFGFAAEPAEALGPNRPKASRGRGLKRHEPAERSEDRKSTRLNSSHANISYAVFCLKKKTT